MLPYLGWTCFATTLINCSLLDSNPEVVQSAHKVAQVKPQTKPADEPKPNLASARSSGHRRNNTWTSGLTQLTQPAAGDASAFPGTTGGISYSSRPILGGFPRNGSHDELSSSAYQSSQAVFPSHPTYTEQNNSHSHGQSAVPQQPAQQRPLLQQASWSHSPSWESSGVRQQQQQQQQQLSQQQPGVQTPFANAYGGQSDREISAERRATRRTTEDHFAPEPYGQLPDSGLPAAADTNKPERASSSGLFSRVTFQLPPCIRSTQHFLASQVQLYDHIRMILWGDVVQGQPHRRMQHMAPRPPV